MQFKKYNESIKSPQMLITSIIFPQTKRVWVTTQNSQQSFWETLRANIKILFKFFHNLYILNVFIFLFTFCVNLLFSCLLSRPWVILVSGEQTSSFDVFLNNDVRFLVFFYFLLWLALVWLKINYEENSIVTCSFILFCY